MSERPENGERRGRGAAPPSPALRGKRLLAARAAWVVVFVLVVALFIAGIPESFVAFQTPCSGMSCSQAQLSPAYVRALEDLGLPLGFYATYTIALQGLGVLVSGAVAAVLFWRRPSDWMALFAAIMLVSFVGATFNDVLDALQSHDSLWRWPVISLRCLGTACLFVFFYLFPDGGFVPRWTRWAALAWVAFSVVGYFSPTDWPVNQGSPSSLFPAMALGFFGTVVIAQVYRYRRVSTPLERQQTKWVLLGFAAALAGLLTLILFVPEAPAGAGFGVLLYLITTLFEGFLLLIPLSIGIAVLRYRLYDIDVVINRALVYSLVTGALVSVYFGGVALIQMMFHALTGGTSQLAVVASTLAIAALFNPLRRRVQGLIDRRFYRRKYDAAKTLETFGAHLRNETDLDQLGDDLLSVVHETLRPEHVSLWLRKPAERGRR